MKTTYQTVVKNVCSDIITELQCLSDDVAPVQCSDDTEAVLNARKEVLTKLLQITLRKLQDL